GSEVREAATVADDLVFLTARGVHHPDTLWTAHVAFENDVRRVRRPPRHGGRLPVGHMRKLRKPGAVWVHSKYLSAHEIPERDPAVRPGPRGARRRPGNQSYPGDQRKQDAEVAD